MDKKEQLRLLHKEIEEKLYQRDILNNVENELNNLNHNINECISLISSSVKGKKATEIINGLTEESKKISMQCNSSILEDKKVLNDNLNELNYNQLQLEERIRQEENEKNEEN